MQLYFIGKYLEVQEKKLKKSKWDKKEKEKISQKVHVPFCMEKKVHLYLF